MRIGGGDARRTCLVRSVTTLARCLNRVAGRRGPGGPIARQHAAVCAERWKQTNTRLSRIEIVLGAIVLPLLVGEGSVIDVLKRLLLS